MEILPPFFLPSPCFLFLIARLYAASSRMSLYQDVRAKLFSAVRAQVSPVKASLTMLWQWRGFLPSCFRPLPNPFHTKDIAGQCRFSACRRVAASGFPSLLSIPLPARNVPTSCNDRKT